MRAFYCDHFVLPLPEGHRCPMSKCVRVRARVVEDGTVAGRMRVGGLSTARVPVAVAGGGGYAHDVADIVRIHAQKVREAGRWHSA